MKLSRSILAGALLCLSACSYHVDKVSADSGGLAGRNLGFSDMQNAILAPKCVSCHTHDHTWMNNYQTVLARLGEIGDRIQSGDAGSMMPPPGSTSLTPDEKAALLQWIAKGGPQQPGQNTPIPTNPVPPPPPPPLKPVPPTLGFLYVQYEVLGPKCLSCHHHTKDFDTFAHTIPTIKEMQTRIHLASTDDDHMPPVSKPQLTPDELQLLDDWINAGAQETGPVIPPLPIPAPAPVPVPSPKPDPAPAPSPAPAPAPLPIPPGPPVANFAYIQAAILAPKCATCHHHAKNSDFTTYAKTQPDLKEMQTRVNEIGTDDQMPPAKATQLTPDELKLLNEWLGKGAPET